MIINVFLFNLKDHFSTNFPSKRNQIIFAGRDSRATFTQTHAMCKQYYRFALNERTTNAARLFINEVNSSDVSILQIANLQFGRLVGISDIRFSL